MTDQTASQNTPPADLETLRQTRPIQQCGPVTSYTERPPGEILVPASTTRLLQPGERVDIPAPLAHPHTFHIQRLTERTYWIWVNIYSMIAYVGDTGILLVDAPDNLPIGALLDHLKEISPLPLTTLVYTHPHVDHNGSGGKLQDILKEQGSDLRIVASEQCVREIRRYKSSLRLPNQVVPNGHSGFYFDGKPFKLVTPADWAHSGGDSYIITPDEVAMVVDFFYPGYLPLTDISGAQNMTGYIEFLRHLAGEEWRVASLGHDNVGYKKDLTQTFDYLQDMYDAAYQVFPGFTPEGLVQFDGQHSGVFIRTLFDFCATQMTEIVKEKWSHLPHWEVARHHAEKVLWDFALNYNYTSAREIGDKSMAVPDFEPLPAPE